MTCKEDKLQKSCFYKASKVTGSIYTIISDVWQCRILYG